MKIKKLLSIALMSFGLLTAACGGSGAPSEKEDGVHTIEITNKAALEADWMVGGSARTLTLTLKDNGTEKAALAEQVAGNLTVTCTDDSVVGVSGFTLNAAKIGKCYIKIQYYETVKVLNMKVVAKPAEPAAVDATVADVLAVTQDQLIVDGSNKFSATKYHVTGYIHDWKSKKGVNEYGEFNLSDSMEENAPTLWIYGSYAENAVWEWTGEHFTCIYDSAEGKGRDFHTSNITKEAKVGDKVELYLIRADYNTTIEAYAQVVALEACEFVNPTSLTLNKTTVQLEVGGSVKLSATVGPWNCNVTAQTWESSDPTVAEVDGTGAVSALKAGNATITLTMGTQTATCAVEVISSSLNGFKCDFTTKTASHGSYSDEWTYGDYKVSGGANNSAQWGFIKVGIKATTTGTEDVTTAFVQTTKPSTDVVSNVVVTIDPSTAACYCAKTGNIQYATIKVAAYSDAACTQLISETEEQDAPALAKESSPVDLTFNAVGDPNTWVSGSYYKVIFTCHNATKYNGITNISKIVFNYVEK